MKILTILLLGFVVTLLFSSCGNRHENRTLYELSKSTYINLNKVTRIQGSILFADRAFPLTGEGIKDTLIYINGKKLSRDL